MSESSFDNHIFTTNRVSPSLSAAQGGPLRFTSGSGRRRFMEAAQVCTLEKSLHVCAVCLFSAGRGVRSVHNSTEMDGGQ